MEKNRKILFFYSSILVITIFMVVFYNKSKPLMIWTIDNFLIPAQYILFIFILLGIYFIINLLKKRTNKYIFLVILIGVISYSGFQHFKINNNRYNYIFYDFANNTLISIEPGSFYFPEEDYINPIGYQQMIQHKTDNINIFMMYNLSNKWGINDFIKKYGQISLNPDNLEMNVGNIINSFFPRKNVYFSYNDYDHIKMYIKNLRFKINGLLYKIAYENEYISSYIFKEYSYRGIFDAKNNDGTKGIVATYSKKLAIQASDYINEKRYSEATKNFKFALLFPENNIKTDIYYNLYLVYKELNDENNQIKYLKETIDSNKSFGEAYQELGEIYKKDGNIPAANEMFEAALKYGNTSKPVPEQTNSGNNDETEQYLKSGDTKYGLDDYKGAIEDYTKALNLNPEFVVAYSHRAVTEYRLEDYKAAINDCNMAIKYNPNLAEAYFNRGFIKNKLGDKQGAVEDLKKAGELGINKAYDKIKEIQGQ